jgi:hypothetical protein
MSPIVPENHLEKDGISGSSQEVLDEKGTVSVIPGKDETKITTDNYGVEADRESADVVIVTGADAAVHLLPMRDDFDKALTFRSIFLASGLACFQAVMYQIYMVRSQLCVIIVLSTASLMHI